MDKDVLEELKSIYNDVSEWLKFAEAKHAALLAGWTAIFAIVAGIDDFRVSCPKVYFAVLIVIMLGIVGNIVAFIPFVNRCKWISKKCFTHYEKKSGNNCIFYQDIFIKSYNKESDEYANVFNKLSNLEIQSKLEKDYVSQIVNVAKVATIKTYMFYLAAVYTMIMFIIGVLFLLIA